MCVWHNQRKKVYAPVSSSSSAKEFDYDGGPLRPAKSIKTKRSPPVPAVSQRFPAPAPGKLRWFLWFEIPDLSYHMSLLWSQSIMWHIYSTVLCCMTVSRELPVEEENVQTQLHKKSSEEHYTYTNVPWKIYLRKEVCVLIRLLLF